jgi:ABC-type transporter MlaC component
MVDTTELARRMLGMPCPLPTSECTNHWGGLTSDQQQEVTELLRRLIEKKVTTDDRKTLAAAISDRRSEKLGNGLTRIRTEAKTNLRSQEAVVQIDYVVIERSDHHYSVVDVVTEGSSMAKGYYVQLHRMLTTPDQGYAFMVKKLEAKLARQ